MSSKANQQRENNSCSCDDKSPSRSGRNAFSPKAWSGKKEQSAATRKGFEHGLPTPGKPRQPVEGGTAAAAAPKRTQYVASKPAPKPAKGKGKKGKQPAKKEDGVTELNLSDRHFRMLSRYLTVLQSMGILMVMYMEGILKAHPEDILREVEEDVDRRLQQSHTYRFCGAYLKGECRHGSKCRDLNLSKEGLEKIGYFVPKEYTGYWLLPGVFQEGSKPVARLIVDRYNVRKTKTGDIVCDKTAPPQLQKWFGAHTSRGAWKAYQPEEAVTLLLRASLMRANVFLARDARQGKKPQTFTLGLSIKLNGEEFTATCFEDLMRQIDRVDPEWGTWFEGDNCCVPEGYLLHPTSKNEMYVLGTIFGLKNNVNLLKTHPQFKAEQKRVSGRNDREAMIGAALRNVVFADWIKTQAMKVAIWAWDEHSGKPLMVKCRGITTEYCSSCAGALKKRWLHEFCGGEGEGRNDIVLQALFDGASDLKTHIGRDGPTWCPGYDKREENRYKRAMAMAEAESGKKPATKSADDATASNRFSALMPQDEKCEMDDAESGKKPATKATPASNQFSSVIPPGMNWGDCPSDGE